MSSERTYIEYCIKQIEDRYQLAVGDSTWKQRDMEYLVNLIEERSGIILSLSTIKRLLKKDDQLPQPATLNALASILDYDDWQQFKIKNSGSIHSKRRFTFPLIISLGLIVLAIDWFLISGFGSSPETSKVEINGPVIFTADKTVSSGVPNTVVFKYDLQNVVADSFFIQQSWNELEKKPIDQNGQYYNSIYYYPGFHRAKLIADDSIIERKFVHITTDGWFPVVRYQFNDATPVYINRSFGQEEPLNISADDLVSNEVDIDKNFQLTYFNVKDFEGISSDNFHFNTRLKADSVKNFVCPIIEVMVMAEQHIYYLQLISKGCERNINLKIGEVRQNGQNNDLSAFGCNVYEWQEIELKVENKHASILLNGQQVREVDFKEDFGEVVGMAITFSGLGSIDFADVKQVTVLPNATD